MNPFNHDTFPYLQQMTQQFQQIFGEDFVKNLMQSMQSPAWWQNQSAATQGAAGMREGGIRQPSGGFGRDGVANGGNGGPTQNGGGSAPWWPFGNGMGQGWPNGADQAQFPACDMYETRHELILVFEVPGIEHATDVKISVLPDVVTVRGDLQRRYGREERALSVSERRVGPFERRVPLPTRVRKQHARATYKQGLLEIRLLKENKNLDGDASMIDVDFLT